jgi:hypothetical protein
MYYEERIVDGVLSWRGSPDGEWQQFSKVELTAMLDATRTELIVLRLSNFE